ncbi:MAG: outer membrane beta-barrel protein [Mesorhizobium sp.]
MVRNPFTASVALAALLYAASPSLAADQVVAPPQEASGPSWTGFYIGVHAGAAFGNMGYDIAPYDYQLGAEDFAYGVHGGFDYQFNNRWVAGFELGYTQLGADYSPFTDNVLVKANSLYSISGRAGYLLTPQTLVYGRLGYAGIRLEAEEGFFDTASKTVGAAQFGIGAETFLWGNVTGRVEANYYHALSKFRINDDSEVFDPHYLLVTAGLAYRFNADRGSAYPAEAAPDLNWSGFYAGVAGSYNFGVMHREIDEAGSTVGPFGSQTFGGGAFAGYNFLFGSSYLLGVEAGAEYLSARFDDPARNSGDPAGPTLFGTVKGVLSLSARAGYFATPSTLVYAKGGFAGLWTDANDEFFALDGGGSKMLAAFQVGAGIESALTDKWSLRVEGLYTKAFNGLVTANSQPDQNELKPSLLTGKIGLAYHF